MAILDLSDPSNPEVTDIWDTIIFDQGAAIAISDGEFAYLGAMDDGVILLNVNNKNDIKFISSFYLTRIFPKLQEFFHPKCKGIILIWF